MPQSNSVSGRRANRTRFTDFQLRTLQQFFDKQAYPKDDDLEVLSKKLQLSPRVIVVWFQNARQKVGRPSNMLLLDDLVKMQLHYHWGSSLWSCIWPLNTTSLASGHRDSSNDWGVGYAVEQFSA